MAKGDNLMPKTMEVRCPNCGSMNSVPMNGERIRCKECSAFLYLDTEKVRWKAVFVTLSVLPILLIALTFWGALPFTGGPLDLRYGGALLIAVVIVVYRFSFRLFTKSKLKIG